MNDWLSNFWGDDGDIYFNHFGFQFMNDIEVCSASSKIVYDNWNSEFLKDFDQGGQNVWKESIFCDFYVDFKTSVVFYIGDLSENFWHVKHKSICVQVDIEGNSG